MLFLRTFPEMYPMRYFLVHFISSSPLNHLALLSGGSNVSDWYLPETFESCEQYSSQDSTYVWNKLSNWLRVKYPLIEIALFAGNSAVVSMWESKLSVELSESFCLSVLCTDTSRLVGTRWNWYRFTEIVLLYTRGFDDCIELDFEDHNAQCYLRVVILQTCILQNFSPSENPAEVIFFLVELVYRQTHPCLYVHDQSGFSIEPKFSVHIEVRWQYNIIMAWS